jgi:hypothetical protein
MLLFDRCRLPIVTRTVKPDDHPQPTQICVYEAAPGMQTRSICCNEIR